MAKQRIYFNSRDTLIRLDIEKIVYFEGDGNYTHIVTANKHKVCITLNLANTEKAMATQLGNKAKHFNCHADLVKYARTVINNHPYTSFLVKGSHSMHMEEITKELIALGAK